MIFLKRITFPPVSFSAALVLLVNGSVAQADTVWLTHDDRLSGTVRYLSDGKPGLDTPYAGTVTLNWSAVSTLTGANSVTVQNNVTGEN